MYKPKYIYIMEYSTKPSQPVNNVLNTNNNKDQGNVTRLNLSTKSRLRNTIKDFGYTCLAFHIGISLLSFGACYTAVDRGMDFAPIIQYLFDTSEEKTKNLITGSTFVVAYSIHKLMAPIRISITLGVTPFLVSYLRKVGIIKTLQRTRILKNSS